MADRGSEKSTAAAASRPGVGAPTGDGVAVEQGAPIEVEEGVAPVEVVYALPGRQWLIEIAYRPGLTAAGAVEASRIVERVPGLEARPLVLGVHGVEVPASHLLEPGDRVEICRPLIADPRRMRVEKVSQGRTMARGRTSDAAGR